MTSADDGYRASSREPPQGRDARRARITAAQTRTHSGSRGACQRPMDTQAANVTSGQRPLLCVGLNRELARGTVLLIYRENTRRTGHVGSDVAGTSHQRSMPALGNLCHLSVIHADPSYEEEEERGRSQRRTRNGKKQSNVNADLGVGVRNLHGLRNGKEKPYPRKTTGHRRSTKCPRRGLPSAPTGSRRTRTRNPHWERGRQTRPFLIHSWSLNSPDRNTRPRLARHPWHPRRQYRLGREP